MSVWGGKITTFRKLAEDAADEISRMLGEARPAWTHRARCSRAATCLHGSTGRPDRDARPDARCSERFVAAVQKKHHRGLPSTALLRRRWPAPTARASISGASGDAHGDVGPTWAPKWRPACMNANFATWKGTSGRRLRRTCCGAAPSWACTTGLPSAMRSSVGSERGIANGSAHATEARSFVRRHPAERNASGAVLPGCARAASVDLPDGERGAPCRRHGTVVAAAASTAACRLMRCLRASRSARIACV